MVNCPECGTSNPDDLMQCKNCGVLLDKKSSQKSVNPAEPSDNIPNPGDILNNKYRIIKQLGKGKFGYTYLVEHIISRKKIVLKIYFKNSITIWKLIKQELMTLHKGSIKGISNIIDSFAYEGRLCLVEDYIDGKTLWNILHERNKLTEEEGKYLLVELLKIVKQLHNQEIIHRDIRPKNIIIKENQDTGSAGLGEVYLIDFGKIKEALLRIKIEKPPLEPSLRGYMPPEKAQGETGYESDIYSIGMTIAEVLTGKLAVVLRTGRDDVKLPYIDPELAYILQEMTKYDRNDRFHNAEEVLRTIKEGPRVMKTERIAKKDTSKIMEPLEVIPDIEEKRIRPGQVVSTDKMAAAEDEEKKHKPETLVSKTEETKTERVSETSVAERIRTSTVEEKRVKRKGNYVWLILICLIIIIALVYVFIRPPEEKEKMEIEITTKPEQANIYTNEVLIDKYPVMLVLDSQKNGIEVKVTKKGYFSRTEKIVYKQGQNKTNILMELNKSRKIIGGIIFAYIREGTFLMGSSSGGDPDERPTHKVLISSFWMSKYEITQKQYKSIMNSNPSAFKGSSNPVDSVNWDDAILFCKKFSLRHGAKVRLAYEAEWEYACRAGTGSKYYWGNSMNGAYCWYSGNSGNRTHPIGQKRPNAWGLYDMSGNVDEWCHDYYEEGYYHSSSSKNPKGPASGYQWKVLRGGSWAYEHKFLRSADRYKFNLREKLKFNGFRVVMKD